MTLTRVDNWNDRLWENLLRHLERPFVWGANDCVLFAANHIDEICASSVYVAVLERWSYSDAAGAARIIAKNGGLRSLVSGLLGEPVSIGACRIGDICLVNIDGRDTIVVHDGTKLLGPSAPKGIERARWEDAVCGWRIGD